MTEYAVPIDEALNRLAVVDDYDPGDGPGPCVHTFMQSAFGLLGAHWKLEAVREAIERVGVQESGEMASGMGHGLVIVEEGKAPVFLETVA